MGGFSSLFVVVQDRTRGRDRSEVSLGWRIVIGQDASLGNSGPRFRIATSDTTFALGRRIGNDASRILPRHGGLRGATGLHRFIPAGVPQPVLVSEDDHYQ